MQQHTHCSYCGQAFDLEQYFPRTCSTCHNITYINPTPVAVVLLPVDEGLLILQRGIPPQVGKWALPGGYIDFGETWQQGCARELWEETGIKIPAESFTLFDVHSPANGGLVLIFGIASAMSATDLPAFVPNEEVLAWDILRKFELWAFPLHTLVTEAFFSQKAGRK